MSLPPKPKSQPVILRTLLAGALAAGSLVACGDDGGTPAIDARQNIDGPIAPQPPPQMDAQTTDAQATDAQATDAQGGDAQPATDAQLP